MMTRDRHSVEKAFHDLRDETRLEFQSIQNEFRQMAGELSSNVVCMVMSIVPLVLYHKISPQEQQ